MCAWDVATRSAGLRSNEPADKILHVELSPDGDALIALNRSSVKLLDAKTGTLKCETHRGGSHLAINWAVGVFTTEPNRFWELGTCREIGIERTVAAGTFAAFSPDGSIYCVEGHMYDSRSRRKLPVVLQAPRGPGAAWPLAFSHDGKFISSGVALWQVSSSMPDWWTKAEGSAYPTGVLFTADDLAVLRSDGNGLIEVRDSSTGAILTRIDAGAPVNAIALSPDGNLLASAGGTEGSPIKLWRHGTLAR